jgi:hypothetical protein
MHPVTAPDRTPTFVCRLGDYFDEAKKGAHITCSISMPPAGSEPGYATLQYRPQHFLPDEGFMFPERLEGDIKQWHYTGPHDGVPPNEDVVWELRTIGHVNITRTREVHLVLPGGTERFSALCLGSLLSATTAHGQFQVWMEEFQI